MKKIMFFATFVVAMMFASCGNKAVTSEDTTEVVSDSVEVVMDSTVVDSVDVVEMEVVEMPEVDA